MRMVVVAVVVGMSMTMIVVVIRDGRGGGKDQTAGLDPLGADQVVGQPPHEFGLAAKQDDFEAAGGVEVNVGSVGQPRDGDSRACYLEIDKNELHWRRIDYDVQQVADKIAANNRLAPSAARRGWRG